MANRFYFTSEDFPGSLTFTPLVPEKFGSSQHTPANTGAATLSASIPAGSGGNKAFHFYGKEQPHNSVTWPSGNADYDWSCEITAAGADLTVDFNMNRWGYTTTGTAAYIDAGAPRSNFTGTGIKGPGLPIGFAPNDSGRPMSVTDRLGFDIVSDNMQGMKAQTLTILVSDSDCYYGSPLLVDPNAKVTGTLKSTLALPVVTMNNRTAGTISAQLPVPTASLSSSQEFAKFLSELGPDSWWRMDNASGNAVDIISGKTLTIGSTVVRGQPTLLADGDENPSVHLVGTSGLSTSALPNSATFTLGMIVRWTDSNIFPQALIEKWPWFSFSNETTGSWKTMVYANGYGQDGPTLGLNLGETKLIIWTFHGERYASAATAIATGVLRTAGGLPALNGVKAWNTYGYSSIFDVADESTTYIGQGDTGVSPFSGYFAGDIDEVFTLNRSIMKHEAHLLIASARGVVGCWMGNESVYKDYRPHYDGIADQWGISLPMFEVDLNVIESPPRGTIDAELPMPQASIAGTVQEQSYAWGTLTATLALPDVAIVAGATIEGQIVGVLPRPTAGLAGTATVGGTLAANVALPEVALAATPSAEPPPDKMLPAKGGQIRGGRSFKG